jgi:hypothetical protein
MPRFRLAACCCLFASIVVVAPALPCLLTCAAEGHMAQMQGEMPRPDHGPLPCHHQLPMPLASVVNTLSATTMLPSVALPVLLAALEHPLPAPASSSLPSVPKPNPDPPPPRVA